MFGRRRNRLIEVTRISSLVADNVEVRGNIVFSGGLRVDGRIEGNVLGHDADHCLLVLSEKGSIKGDVHVYDAVINGTIEGNLEVDHFVELQTGSRITGNITYRQLQMDCGASVEGTLERLAETESETQDKIVDLNPSVRTATTGA